MDTEQTPGCRLVSSKEELEGRDFPDCCPVYDCEEGTDVVYVTPPPRDEEPRSAN